MSEREDRVSQAQPTPPGRRSNRLFAEIAPGESASSRRVCTEQSLYLFAQASRNINPLHIPDREARIDADVAGTGAIADGGVLTACQQACPTRAISFGNIKDKASAVAHEKAEPQAYALLAELGTRPRTTYLARLRDGGET